MLYQALSPIFAYTASVPAFYNVLSCCVLAAGPSNGVSGMPGMLGAGMGNVTSGKGLFLAGLGAQYLGSMSGGLPPGLGSGMPGMLGAGMGLGAPPFWGMHSQMHNSLKDSLLRPPAA